MTLSMPPALRPQPRPARPLQFGNQMSAVQSQARMTDLGQQYPVLQTMFDLIDIPSATPQKDPRFAPGIEAQMKKMRTATLDKFRALGVSDITVEPNGSVIIRLPGSPGYENARPLMLTAHMDIVPGDPENPTRTVQRTVVQRDGREWIASDGTTTLGADDKGGMAMILDAVARLQGKHPAQLTPLPHVPLEILLSPNEESSCDSLKTLDTSKFKARHVLVVDEFSPFKVTTGLASAVMIDVEISGLHGGHSGEDINKPDRLNAILLMGELARKLGSGVIAEDPRHPGMPLISKNIGVMQGGSAPNAIPEKAKMTLMLRSGSAEAQRRELARITRVVQALERKYQAVQPGLRVALKIEEEYPAWQGDPHSPIHGWARQAAQAMNGPKVEVGPVHAAAQASILANKKNAYGEGFDAVLIGPRIEEAHTVRERVDWRSVVDGSRWLGEILRVYTSQAK